MPDVNPLPVDTDTREALQSVRGDEQSYDDLLKQLVDDHHRLKLVEQFCVIEARDADELVSIDDV